MNCCEMNANEIEIKYFESGHTFMSADSFHHQIEQSMFKGSLFDFGDFKEAVQNANSGKRNEKL